MIQRELIDKLAILEIKVERIADPKSRANVVRERDALTRVRDRATYSAPHAAPEAILHVIVNGVFVVRDGEATDARPGVVLRLKI